MDLISTTFPIEFNQCKPHYCNLFFILLTTLCQISKVRLRRVIGMPKYLKDHQFDKHGKSKILDMF
jgi:hypothetical protein